MTPADWRRLARFNAVGGLGIGVQFVVLWALTAGGVHYLPTTVLAVATAVVHNFAWHRRWTWSDRSRRPAWGRHLAQFASANGAVSLGGNVLVMAVLSGGFGVPVLTANATAIAACGLVNYWTCDKIVFRFNPTATPAP